MRLDNFDVVNAIHFIIASACKWHALPAHCGPWHTIYTRMSRWAKAGMLDWHFEHMQRRRLLRVRIATLRLDCTIVKMHPDGTDALKKAGSKPSVAAEAA